MSFEIQRNWIIEEADCSFVTPLPELNLSNFVCGDNHYNHVQKTCGMLWPLQGLSMAIFCLSKVKHIGVTC